MNKLGVHALVWEHGWSKEQATRAINKSAEAGFDFIEAPSGPVIDQPCSDG